MCLSKPVRHEDGVEGGGGNIDSTSTVQEAASPQGWAVPEGYRWAGLLPKFMHRSLNPQGSSVRPRQGIGCLQRYSSQSEVSSVGPNPIRRVTL